MRSFLLRFLTWKCPSVFPRGNVKAPFKHKMPAIKTKRVYKWKERGEMTGFQQLRVANAHASRTVSTSIMYNKFVWMVIITEKSDWGGIHSNVKSLRSINMLAASLLAVLCSDLKLTDVLKFGRGNIWDGKRKLSDTYCSSWDWRILKLRNLQSGPWRI